MAIIYCKKCKKETNSALKKCQHCGVIIKQRMSKTHKFLWLAAMIVFTYFVIIANKPADETITYIEKQTGGIPAPVAQ